MPEHYDYLVAGAGLFGCVFAREMTDLGKRCLIIDKRPQPGGNIHCEQIEDICVHRYGAHIFHTSDETVWAYVNRFAQFNHYVNSPMAVYQDQVYNLPFNMNTFSRLWGIRTPEEARAEIARQTQPYQEEPENLEQQALKLVGSDIYEKLIKGYTEKQWGRDCKDLPAFIIRRLPLRYTYDNNYFNDAHQGIPGDGYDALVERLIEGIDFLPNTDYFEFSKANPGIANKTVFSGMIDEFFDFCYGHLEYRTVRFEDEIIESDNYQGNAVVNYTEREIPFTRIIEHKHFVFGTQPRTIISREYPMEWEPGMEPFYPVNDAENQMRYQQYQKLATERADIIFGGRLGHYAYYDMDKTIRAALDTVARELT